MASEPRPGPGDVLTIPAEIYDAMVAHCRADAPLECCGLLGGVFPNVSLFYPLANAEASETRYNADPRDLIRAVQDLRAREADILAIYHSHPRWAPIPSRADLDMNYCDDTPRVIVSLLTDPPEVGVWRLGKTSYAAVDWRVAR